MAVMTISCGNTINKNLNEEVIEEDESTDFQTDILLGEFQKEDLQKKPHSIWFEPEYEQFEPQPAAMEQIRENIGDYEIKLLMGTWCGDSRREVSKFLKLLDNSNYDYDQLQMVAVDHNKTTPSQLEKELEVEYVPTIIFYIDGKEVNRFVEYPMEESIEEDIAKIVAGEEYTNAYAQ